MDIKTKCDAELFLAKFRVLRSHYRKNFIRSQFFEKYLTFVECRPVERSFLTSATYIRNSDTHLYDMVHLCACIKIKSQWRVRNATIREARCPIRPTLKRRPLVAANDNNISNISLVDIMQQMLLFLHCKHERLYIIIICFCYYGHFLSRSEAYTYKQCVFQGRTFFG